MESRKLRLTGSADPSPELAPSRIKRYKTIEGEQRSLKLPLVALHKRYGRPVRALARSVAFTLDAVSFPLKDVKGKAIVAPKIALVGAFGLVMAVPVWVLFHFIVAAAIHQRIGFVLPVLRFAMTAIPAFMLFVSVISLVAAARLKAGRSFTSLLKDWHSPQPAWAVMPVFRIGTVRKLLKDLWEGTICFGGVGSGKTVGFVAPILIQLLRKLNNPDPKATDARFFGLFLDVKGNFADLTLYLMLQVGRPMSDLIIVDPDLDLYRWNPLDAQAPDFAERGAETLAAVNRIMGNESKGENIYWDQTSQNVIRYILKNLSIIRQKKNIGLDDVGRFVRDDDRVFALMKQAAAVLEYRRRNGQIAADEYDELKQAISELRNNWAKLDGRTKNILKTTIANMLGPIPTTPRLQRIFCRDSNFSMEDVINDGKIVIYRARTLPPQTARMLAVCFSRDFQIWSKRRLASEWGLNTTRTGVYLVDEFQEVVTSGREGDAAFFGLCREARIACIVATQLRSSLAVAIGKNEDELDLLLGNLTTKVFLKLSDKKTQEIGAFYSGKYYRERERSTIHKGGVVGAMVTGKEASRDASTNIDEQLEDFFRPDDFSRLRTMDKLRSVKGPYYSEAIIYNYSEDDVEKTSWAEKTKLHHLYPNRDEMRSAATSFEDLLHARNAQARVHRMFFLLVATGEAARKRAKIDCDSHASTLQEKINATAERKRESQAMSVADIINALKPRLAQLEAEDKKAQEELVAYERTHGRHGRDYPKLHEKAMKSAAEHTAAAVQWKIAMSPTSSPIFAGNRATVAELLKGRSVADLISEAGKKGVPSKVVQGSDAELAEKGPTVGVTPVPGTQNAHEVQASALPGRPPALPKKENAAAAETKGEESSTRPNETPASGETVAADQLTALVQAALQQPTSQTGYERQVQEHHDRFRDADIDKAYETTFPSQTSSTTGPQSAESEKPQSPRPATSTIPLGDPTATAAKVDEALKTSEADYS